MKNYLGFSLTGSKLFPVWLVFYVLFLAPSVFLMVKISGIDPSEAAAVLGLYCCLLVVLVIIEILVIFYIRKILIENIQYNNLTVGFNGRFLNYLGIVFLGIFLTIITIGIYAPWFQKRLMNFFVNNSELENESFKFKSSGSKLFVITLLGAGIPLVISVILIVTVLKGVDPTSLRYSLLSQIIPFFLMIPYVYLYYKWLVNIEYKNYNIAFNTKFWHSCGKILLEYFLTLITCGIYTPMAYLRLYKYFADRTVAQSFDNIRNFGFEPDYLEDFPYIWGQMLLSIVTVGLYCPWMICKVSKRFISRTYLE